MIVQLPFHSLVLCQDYSYLDNFINHERLSIRIVENDLVGNNSRFRSSSIILNELYHRVNLKLSLGERVVVYVGDLSVTEQNQLQSMATNQGAHVSQFQNEFITAMPYFVQSQWKGITIVGDVHGDLKSLSQTIEWAQSRQHYIWFLGDIIDYGKESLETMNRIYNLVMYSKASMILGNHERKIARWIEQKEQNNVYLRLSDGNKITINAIEKLSPIERKKWLGRFRALISHSTLLQKLNNITLVHAAAHPSLWNVPNDILVEQFALYGESVHTGKTFNRIYNWVDDVPDGQLVFVGHDVQSKWPIVKTNTNGGKVVFLDTGCGKDGLLSSADLKFDTNGNLRIECFHRCD